MTDNTSISEDQILRYAVNFQSTIPAVTSQSYLTSPTIKVAVGGDETPKSFFIHETLITSRSCFFRKALQKHDEEDAEWLEDSSRTVHLPDDCAKTFTAYLQLLYYNRVPSPEKIVTEGKTTEEIHSAVIAALDAEHNLLAALYVFAEKVQDDVSKDLIFSAFGEASKTKRANGKTYSTSTEAIRDVFEGTVDTDPLRKWLVDCFVYRANAAWVTSGSTDMFHPDFTLGVMMGMARVRDLPKGVGNIHDVSKYRRKVGSVDGDGDAKQAKAS